MSTLPKTPSASKHAPCFGMVAGETSGDKLGQAIMLALKKIYPNARFIGIGGDKMLKAGLETLGSMEVLSVMGFIEPLKKLPQILSLRSKIIKHFKDNPPDCYIGIDAPDFNIGIEKVLKNKTQIKTVHVVTPTIWAWRENRIHTIKKAVDLMLLIYPFEKSIFDQHHLTARYIGHPLADEIPVESNKTEARNKLGLPQNTPLVALMPGSRAGEIKALGKCFFETAHWLKQKIKNIKFLVPCVSELRKAQLLQSLGPQSELSDFTFVVDDAQSVMQASDAILCASGTAALQAAMIKRPFAVAYKVSWLTYQIAKRVIKVKYISTPNIISGRQIVPEFIQQDATPEKMGQALLTYLKSPEQCGAMMNAFQEIHQSLKCNAGQRAGEAIQQFLEK